MKFVRPAGPPGAAPTTTTFPPSFITPCARSSRAILSTRSSLRAGATTRGITPRQSASWLAVAGRSHRATIGIAGRSLERIWAVRPDRVNAAIAPAPTSLASVAAAWQTACA